MPVATIQIRVLSVTNAVIAAKLARAAINSKLSEPPTNHPDVVYFALKDVSPLASLLDSAAESVAAGNPFNGSERSAAGIMVTVAAEPDAEQTNYTITLNDDV